MIDGDVLFYLKFWAKVTHPFKTATSNRHSLLVPQWQKNSIRKSTTGFPMSLRWTAYVASKRQCGLSVIAELLVLNCKMPFSYRTVSKQWRKHFWSCKDGCIAVCICMFSSVLSCWNPLCKCKKCNFIHRTVICTSNARHNCREERPQQGLAPLHS